MDIYQELSTIYKDLLKRDSLTSKEKHEIETKILAFDSLSGKDDVYKRALFSTGAFNDIVKDYIRETFRMRNEDPDEAEKFISDFTHCLDVCNL
ncbi:hypothetical protein M2146_001107 [Lachnospiraceae bacterium PF1-22]